MTDFRKNPTVLTPDRAVKVLDNLKYLEDKLSFDFHACMKKTTLQRVHFYQKLHGFNGDSLFTLVLWTLSLRLCPREARML